MWFAARTLTTVVGLLLLAPMALNAWVVGSASPRIISRPSQLPPFSVALVLGTSPYLANGSHNVFFTQRMFTAARLYKLGCVQELLISGANPSTYYNEPRQMFQALTAWGVPNDAITLDFAGFRTLDSVVRAKKIFGLDRAIIVTQRFHAYRAVFLANLRGLDAVAFVPRGRDRGPPLLVAAREYLARIKAVFDIYLFHTNPRYLGPVWSIDTVPQRIRILRGLIFQEASCKIAPG